MKQQQPTIFVFDRSKNIIPCNYEAFLTSFSPQLLTKEKLAGCLDSVAISVYGYDDDPRELPEIPEVRKFFQSLHSAWPYFVYFLNVKTETVLLYFLCVAPAIELTRKTGADKFQSHTTAESMDFVLSSFYQSHMIFDRAGFSDKDEIRRTDEILRALVPKRS